MQNNIENKDLNPDPVPDPRLNDPATFLRRASAGWYVRRDGKFYDVQNPIVKFSFNDVKAACVQRFRVEFPWIELTNELVRASIDAAAHGISHDPTLSFSTWNGLQRCEPGNPDRLLQERGMVTLNSWVAPAYRELCDGTAEPGVIGDFLDFAFETEDEKNTFLNWVAWCLQNEEKKPTWGPLLYSKAKGTGKSTLTDIVARLFGEENTLRQNGVDKLTAKFNQQFMLSKLIVSEELDLKPGTRAANALKTYMTEENAAVEAKGQEVGRIRQCFACIFTTNHLPLWIEENDRRYWVVELDHAGCAGGEKMAEFTELVGNVKAYLSHDAHVARLYDWLMQRALPAGFTGAALNDQVHRTRVMERIVGNGAQTIVELLEEYLDGEGIVAISEANLVAYVTGPLKGSVNQTKHLASELGWHKVKAKWGGVDYARSIWLRKGYGMVRGKVQSPDGQEFEVAGPPNEGDEYLFPMADRVAGVKL